MTATPCPSCRALKGPGKYLCPKCWAALPRPARRSLSRRDAHAIARLQELYDQIRAGVPLSAVQVSP